MRRALSIGLLLASLLAAPAQPASLSRFPKVRLYNMEYVRLDDWARANSYTVSWTVPRREVRLSHPSGTSLSFSVDSRKMTLRGITIWLSHPIAFQNGSAHVGSLDLATAIHPVLYPAKNSPSRKVSSIVLDPGHGGKDPGNLEGQRREKDYTLLLSRELRDILVRSGFKVSFTRDRDTFVELPSRAALANRRGADLFISLHFNSTRGSSAVKGAETFCMTPVRASSTNARGEGSGAGAYPGNRFDQRNILLAYHIQKALEVRAGMEDRGVKRARFAVLRDAEMPAVLIEAGFMSHPSDAQKIYDAGQRRRMAQAIADGILAYRSQVDGI